MAMTVGIIDQFTSIDIYIVNSYSFISVLNTIKTILKMNISISTIIHTS